MLFDTPIDDPARPFERAEGARQVATPLRIFDIVPNSTQPRRVVPTAVRQTWDGDARQLGEMLDTWHRLAEAESGMRIDLGARLEQAADDPNADLEKDFSGEAPPTHGPLTDALLELARLAGSIRQAGLTNPITVARVGGAYEIETGERRWLAFHLLYHIYGDESYVRIPARLVEQINVWRQAWENNVRADLNAVGRARQYAILMMELHQLEGKSFGTYDTYPDDQAYYAQAAELNVPYGRGELLLNALGVKHRSAFSRFRKILRAPRVVWEAGDDYNLALNDLVRLSGLSVSDAKAALAKLLRGALAFGDLEAPAEPEKYEPIISETSTAPGSKKHFSQLLKHIQKAAKGDHDSIVLALHDIGILKQWLGDQEAALRAADKGK